MRIGSCLNGIDKSIIICYNNIMETVIITDSTKATNASRWCSETLKPSEWDLVPVNLFTKSMKYVFSFSDPHRATEFALRWV